MTNSDRDPAPTPSAPAQPAGLEAPGAPPGPPSLDPARLRWTCDPASLPFESTEQVRPVGGVIGQDTAVESLRFGLETRAPGQNVFVRGLVGTGRATLVRQLMEELRMTCPPPKDRCYVHDFARPERPRLLTLPPGRAHAFRRKVDRIIRFISQELPKVMGSETARNERSAVETKATQEMDSVVKPFEETIRQAGFALASVPQAGGRPLVVPLIGGQPVGPEALEQARQAGQLPPQALEQIESQRREFQGEVERVTEQAQDIRRRFEEELRGLVEKQVRSALDPLAREIEREFNSPEVEGFIRQIVTDVVEHRVGLNGQESERVELYRVNVVLGRAEGDRACAIVVETAPTVRNLLGTIGAEIAGEGTPARSNHMRIRAGSLLRADGGYLILEARDVLMEPGSWKVLLRTIKTGRLEITPPEMLFPFPVQALSPEPIDVQVKVVLIGDHEIFAQLDYYDPDFQHLFKVLVDFDSTIPRDDASLGLYAGVLARIVREEALPPFERGAVAALAEHGARIAARSGKLTARFGRLADIARESAWIATKESRAAVGAGDVREAVRRSKRRADLPARRFRELVAQGVVRVQTKGAATGQINGLAVIQAGPLVYGFPARITATIGAGSAGLINIEREAALSGAIHTKGFYLLGGVLRTLLQTDHPLAFNASIAFEQSYGGIDGDSASGAEVCCLLSALTNVPLRQDTAMTGAVDQKGNVQAVGAVNEKIEGFFDTCQDLDPTASCGVIIPQANAGDLMLREDLVVAARQGRLRIYAVSTVQEALGILTGIPAGERDATGRYPEGSLLGIAMAQAREFWRRAAPHDGHPEEAGAAETE